MREIKFRAWDKDYKYMTKKVMVGNVWDAENYHAHMLWVDPEKVDYECEPGWRNFDENTNIEIMQYTGLKDVKGVDIYEGDILKYFGECREVIYRESSFGWMEDGNYYAFTEMAPSEIPKTEIVSNIYEHPELLESKL